MKSFSLLCVLALITLFACNPTPKVEQTFQYPISQKVDSVDDYFGMKVSDPYRWMENDTAKATADWVKSENEITFGFLNKISYRDSIKKRLEALYNYERLTAPFKEGDFYYYYKNDGLQNHSVLYRKKGERAAPEVFLDPNTFSKDGTTRLAGVSFSKDGSRVGFQISKGGADWTEAIIINASRQKDFGRHDTKHQIQRYLMERQ